jgi:hypothetical protein
MIKLFEVISVNIIYFVFSQTWASLTDTDLIVAFFRGRREYFTTLSHIVHDNDNMWVAVVDMRNKELLGMIVF